MGGHEIKNIEAFDNTLRHILNGQAKAGWLHGRLKLEIRKGRVNIKIFSMADGTLLKQISPSANIGDDIELTGAVVSYPIEFKSE
jgi:hypothetical protein